MKRELNLEVECCDACGQPLGRVDYTLIAGRHCDYRVCKKCWGTIRRNGLSDELAGYQLAAYKQVLGNHWRKYADCYKKELEFLKDHPADAEYEED